MFSQLWCMMLLMADSSDITGLTVRINISDIFEFFHIDSFSLQEHLNSLTTDLLSVRQRCVVTRLQVTKQDTKCTLYVTSAAKDLTATPQTSGLSQSAETPTLIPCRWYSFEQKPLGSCEAEKRKRRYEEKMRGMNEGQNRKKKRTLQYKTGDDGRRQSKKNR